MAEIKRVYRQSLPAVKLVGRRYGDADRVNGMFAHKWDEWFSNDLFAPLKIDGGEPFDDCGAPLGVCRMNEGVFEYWIGVFMPPDAAVPAGYESFDVEAGEIAVCWVYGREPDIYMHDCMTRLKDEGLEWAPRSGVHCFERYACPRFTQPDEKGNKILDICFYIKP